MWKTFALGGSPAAPAPAITKIPIAPPGCPMMSPLNNETKCNTRTARMATLHRKEFLARMISTNPAHDEEGKWVIAEIK
jgi:hypothetical protein